MLRTLGEIGLRGIRSRVRIGGLRVRDGVLIGLVAVLIVLAGVVHTQCSVEDAAPADRFVEFYCPKCDHHFRVSERDFERLLDARQYKPTGPRAMVFRCEKCGQMTAEVWLGDPDEPLPADGG